MTEHPDSPFLTSLAHHAADPFRLLVESVEDYAIFMVDPAGNVASWNPGAERIYGYRPPQIVGRPVSQLYTPDENELEKPAAARKGALATGYFGQECQLQRKDGSTFWATVTTSILRDYFGNHAGFSMVTRDITERRAAEERLRRERDLLDAILGSLPGVYYMYDESRHFIRWNAKFEQVTGYTAEEIASLDPLDLFEGESREQVAAAIEGVFRTGFGQVEAMFLSKGGRQTPYYFNGIRAEIDGKICLLGMGIDITDQKRAQQELRANDERMRQAARAGSVGLWDIDLVTDEVFYSPEWKMQLGYEEHEIGHSVTEWEDRLHPDDRPGALQAMIDFVEQPTTYRYEREFRMRHRDGSYRRILSQASLLFDEQDKAVRMLGSHVDVTEQRRLQQQIQQAQKMEAVGQLAAGVAHDFNNLVTVITGFSDLVLSDSILDEQTRDHIEEIREAGIRAGSLTRQLLSFCRKQLIEPKVLNANAVVANTEKMLNRLIGRGVTLETTLHPALGMVLADPGQLELVLVNLAVNGRDAMPGGDRLTIETRPVVVEDSSDLEAAEVEPGSYALITVSDTGTGIDEETRAHIFEPFFTTKGEGSGTGLGLATVQSVVAEAGGRISVHSEIGLGTTFKIYLPVVSEPGEEHAADPPPSSLPTGTETILIVEDEAAIRTLEAAILRRRGYRVLEAASAAEALRIAESRDTTIDLVVSDSVLPDGDARTLIPKIAAILPATPVVLMSGQSETELSAEQRTIPVIAKPFTPGTLATAVRSALDAGG